MFEVSIMEVATGKVVVRQEEGSWEEHEYIWTEGNWSCDCNRYLFFHDFPDEEDETPCGGSLFKIEVREGGDVVYVEIEEA